MNAQVEVEVAEVEVPEVAIPGGQKKFKLIVNVPVEVEIDGETRSEVAEVEFGPFDTEERVGGEAEKFLARGYASRVATIFTCSSVRLALTSLPKIEVLDIVAAEPESKDETETVDNGDAVAAILDGFEGAKDETEVAVDDRGELTDEDRDAAYAENEARDAKPAEDESKDEAKAEEPAPAPKRRSTRRTRSTAANA